MRRYRLPPALATAALAAASALLALAAGEGLTRAFSLAPTVGRILLDDADSPIQASDNPVQGFELKRNFASPRHPGFRTNSSGLRGPERVLPKPAGVRRIALVGDSVVFGAGLERDEDTIASRLEALFPPAARVEVINTAVVGYNTQAEIELLRRRAVPYGLDLVIVVFVRNDHYTLRRHAGGTFGHPRPRLVEQLFTRSALFRFAAFQLNLFHLREDLDPDYLDARIGRAQAEDNVARGLAELARLSAQHGFRPLVAVWPNFGPTIIDPPGLAAPGSDRLRVETAAARLGIPVVRLSAAFAGDYARRGPGQPSPRDLYTFDGMHPNAEGARAAAAVLRQLIRERRLLGDESG